MDFLEIQQGAVNSAKKYGEKYTAQIDEEFAMLKLVEEVGELAQALLIH